MAKRKLFKLGRAGVLPLSPPPFPLAMRLPTIGPFKNQFAQNSCFLVLAPQFLFQPIPPSPLTHPPIRSFAQISMRMSELSKNQSSMKFREIKQSNTSHDICDNKREQHKLWRLLRSIYFNLPIVTLQVKALRTELELLRIF